MDYSCYANKPVRITVEDPSGAVIEKDDPNTDKFGDYHGTFQLADECSIGNWTIKIQVGRHTSEGSFDVEAYRKPEYTVTVTTAKPTYSGGETIPFVDRTRKQSRHLQCVLSRAGRPCRISIFLPDSPSGSFATARNGTGNVRSFNKRR